MHQHIRFCVYDRNLSLGDGPVSLRHRDLFNLCKRFLRYEFPIELELPRADHTKFLELSDWCEKYFNRRFCIWIDTIYIQSEDDAFKFKMRWT